MFPHKFIRTEKPESSGIDWANPLSKGLKALHLYNNGSGVVKDLCRNFDLSINNATPAIIKNGLNRSLDYSPTTSYANTTGDVFGALGFTVTAVVDLSGLSTASEQVIISNSQVSASAVWAFCLQLHDNGNAGSLYARGVVRNGTYVPVTGTTDLFVDKGIHTITFRSTSATLREIFVDGVLEGTSTTSESHPAGVDTLQTGYVARNGSITSTGPYEGIIVATFCHGRVLTNSEIKALNQNPYQLLKPRLQPIENTVPAAGGAFQAAWALQQSSIIGAI